MGSSGSGAVLVAWASTVLGVSPTGLPGCFDTFLFLPPP